MYDSPETLQAAFNAEFGDIVDVPIVLKMSSYRAWAIMAALQLALRHPQFDGPIADQARDTARQLQNLLATTPALATVAERGWDKET